MKTKKKINFTPKGRQNTDPTIAHLKREIVSLDDLRIKNYGERNYYKNKLPFLITSSEFKILEQTAQIHGEIMASERYETREQSLQHDLRKLDVLLERAEQRIKDLANFLGDRKYL